jgi:hypothetical protein
MTHRKFLIFCLLLSGLMLAAASAAASPICTSLTTGSAAVGDVLINSGNPDQNYDGAGSTVTGTNHGKTSDTLMHLDVSFIPAGATINSATVTLKMTAQNGGGATVNVYQILGGWNPDNVTWDDFTAGYNPSPVASFVTKNGSVSFDLTALVQAWVSGKITNYGLLLSQASGQTSYDFSVSENLQILNVCYTSTAQPSLKLTKTVSTNGVCPGLAYLAVPGGTKVTDCYQVTNTGNVPVSGIVVLDGEVTTGVAIGTLNPGQSATASASFVPPWTVDIAATATGLASGVSVTSPSSDALITVLTSSLSLVKTVAPGSGQCPGVSSLSVTAGSQVTYCYLVTNTGTLPLSGVFVTDGSSSISIGNLAPGASGSGSLSTVAVANANSPAVASAFDVNGAPLSSGQTSASVVLLSGALGVDASCSATGSTNNSQTVSSSGHENATCASGDGFTVAQATAICGANVQYFAYTCTDFAGDTRAWTASFTCCLPPGGPTCTDGIKNGTETDIDCGGQCPFACYVGQKCIYDTDCRSDFCYQGVCAVPSVLNSTCINNGMDTTIHNVGWPKHENGTCDNGFEAFTIEDAAALCPGGVVKYFDYTCTDFPLPPPYNPQRAWEADYSCCFPQCSDGVRDGNESDVDCGSACPYQCLPGQHCFTNTDCQTDYCNANGTCDYPPVLSQDCQSDGNNVTIDNPSYPNHDPGTCEGGFQGLTIQQAAANCPSGKVKYFDYTCTDFPAAPPYQSGPQRGWEADYACCVPGSCTPVCAGKQCGTDGCGGTCGTCPAGTACALQTGQCQ